jgi:hypothetical protein
LCWRDLNFGVFASLTRFAVVAMFLLSIFTANLFEADGPGFVSVTLRRGRAYQNPSAERGRRCHRPPL